MTPAEELRAAAEKIRYNAAKASSGTWTYNPDEDTVHNGGWDIATSFEHGDGHHIALWQPNVALIVASILEAQGALGNTSTLLDLARAINGGAR